MMFADRRALVEKRGACQIASKRPAPDEIILAVIERRKGVGFEQGGVGTSVYRAFLLLVGRLPHWAKAKHHGAQ